MPSFLIDNSFSGPCSGGCPLFSGNPFSGRQVAPQSQLVIVADPRNSGLIYVNFSGGLTVTSGAFPLSGGGLLDGMPVPPGAAYNVPRAVFTAGSNSGGPWGGQSGGFGIFLACDAAASGRARVFWEAF